MTKGHGLDKTIKAASLKVDGKAIPMKGFVQDFVGLTVAAMVSNLKGVGKPREIELKIKVR
ncbi:MAG: hypothetical protein NTY77_10720 [Elusimicrobia bacterium]|nr:hypothetical protein [Elusimicrobiota bacterium]